MKLVSIFIILFFSIIVSAKPLVIAVIDTGITASLELPLCKNGHKSYFNGSISDDHGHGTVVTQLINSVIGDESKNYCFLIVKVFGFTNRGFEEKLIDGIEYVSNLDIDIVNISAGGYTFSEKEERAIMKLHKRKVLTVTAAGNDSKNLNKLCNYYPACYSEKNIVIGQSDSNKSNYGDVVDIKLPGKVKLTNKKEIQGTSFSTARATGGLVRIMLKGKK